MYRILMVLLIAAAVACFAVDGGRLIEWVTQLSWNQQAGLALLLSCSLVGMLGMSRMRGRCREMARAMASWQPGGEHPHISTSTRDLVPVAESANWIIKNANQAVAAAQLRAREIEIQLKVATAERQHAESIIYSISDAVLVTDRYDEVVLANESAARALEFDLKQAERAPVEKVLGDPAMIELIRDMRQSNSRGGRRIVEHQVKSGAGERTFKLTLSRLADRSNNTAGVVAVLHDMTREKEVAQVKNEFVSHVSHELRTPLASIKAYVEMLIDGEAEDEKTQREFFEVIQNEANRLGRLIDNMLNISRIESGLVKIDKRPVSLTTVLSDALEVIAPQAKMKNITINEQLTPVFYQTLADRDMLYQAVLNLLSNSVKYTPEGGSITVQTIVDETSRKVATRISDTGAGIPPKDLPFVFDKFYRVEANKAMAKGTGLGLSLVKQIIETVHHGRIFVESEVGKGTTFCFELDLCD